MSRPNQLIPIQQLIDRVDVEYASVTKTIVDQQRTNDGGPERLRSLADARTAALVELSQHYLPDLSHQHLADTWMEIRTQIREILLRKDDRTRVLTTQLQPIESRRQTLEARQHELRQQLEKARLDLCSKQGNVHKLLREDDGVAACLAEIGQIDLQIEQALCQLDTATSEAKKKLPDYETSALFQYLQDRGFGTPQYRETGIERRWDRWLAKLIDYRKSKKSYDLLRETPTHLQQLIDRKRDRYKNLLEDLERARAAAANRFGVHEQQQDLERLSDELDSVDQMLSQLRQQESEIGSELCEIASTDGHYYLEAIGVYRKFLADLDPEILQVYAECTASPIDDQICARMKNITTEIDAESARCQSRKSELDNLKKYRVALWELSQRLRQHVQCSSLADELIERISLDPYLDQLRQQSRTPAEVWQSIRKSIIYQAEPILEPTTDRIMDPGSDILQASFLAAANEWEPWHPVGTFDPHDVLLVSDTDLGTDSDPAEANGGFRLFAFCESRTEAQSLVTLLEQHDIPCFAHDPKRDGPFTLKHRTQADAILVMVQDWRFDDATNLIGDLRRPLTAIRLCSRCEATVENGWQVCWNCLAPVTS